MRKVDRKILKKHLSIFVFALLQRNLSEERIVEVLVENDVENHFNRIRCPLCKWKPSKSSRWQCMSGGFPEFYSGGCGTVWNTFETRGKCPGCAHQWRWTVCLSCYQNSLHEDWYSKSDY